MTNQKVTDMTAKEKQCLPKEAAEILKGTLLFSKTSPKERTLCLRLAYPVAKVQVASTHAHSGCHVGHAHDRDRMIVLTSCVARA